MATLMLVITLLVMAAIIGIIMTASSWQPDNGVHRAGGQSNLCSSIKLFLVIAIASILVITLTMVAATALDILTSNLMEQVR